MLGVMGAMLVAALSVPGAFGDTAILFAAAVISLVVLTNLLVAGVYVWTGNYAMPQEMDLVHCSVNCRLKAGFSSAPGSSV